MFKTAGGSAICKHPGIELASGVEWVDKTCRTIQGDYGPEEICADLYNTGNAQCGVEGLNCIRAYAYDGAETTCYTTKSGGSALCKPYN